MTIPKRHHYVPRFILANFVDNTGKLWVRRLEDGRVWPASPEDVYVERHRYSFVDVEGKHDPALECAYSVLEGMTKPVIDKLLKAARTSQSPVITAGEKSVWDEFLYHQMKRVPAAISAVIEKQDWNTRLEAVIESLQKRGVDMDDKALAELRSSEGLKRLAQNATVKALSSDSPLIRVLLGAANIEIGVAPMGSSFVISSHPIAGVSKALESTDAETPERWLPIASDVAVRIAFDCVSRTQTLSPEKITLININSRMQGDFLAGASEALVESVD